MSTNTSLPAGIAQYIDATNKQDMQRFIAAFHPQAVVQDEGHTYTGHKAIAQWRTKTNDQYSFTLEVTGFMQAGNEVQVTAQCTGSFPGSPIQLEQHFTLQDGRITALTIR